MEFGDLKRGRYRRADTTLPNVSVIDNAKDENTKRKVNRSTWSNLWVKIKVLLPYLWPKSQPWLQARVIFCVLLLLSLRGVNVLVPRLNKQIVDALASGDGKYPYDIIIAFTGVKFLQGGVGRGGGLVTTIKNILWIKVQQFTTKGMRLRLFNHLHKLGIRWHHSRKTGEVLRVMDRGTSSITTLLNTAFFQIIPIIIDVFVAMAALSYDLNFYFGLIILVTMIVYLVTAIIGTEYRTKFKRKMNEADNEQRARSVDSLLNSETVKLYGNEKYEGEMFSEFMDKYQGKEWMSQGTMYLFNMLQSIVLNSGVLFGSLYCAYLISLHKLTVGDYVLFGTYMTQLIQPLNQLAMLYRTIQEAMINMENMLDLLAEEEEIQDIPGAITFTPKTMNVELKNVTFHYTPERPILKNVSFVVPEATTMAIVGPSGSGKSTIMKLLLRFYDPIEGQIMIDDQDIKVMKQISLRENIGVVPQDTVLFNETIEFNISYGKIGSTLEDIKEVACLADVNDRINSLPDGYKTKVGERGLKLSGGEKQRVAIARTFLRSPKLLLLDEATSALDTATERNIQSSLARVCKDRTCIIVAHRLSTVRDADQILVLADGEIVERGTHEELIEMGKVYAEMWSQQQASGIEIKEENKEQRKGSQGTHQRGRGRGSYRRY